jgi:hypothetical protein
MVYRRNNFLVFLLSGLFLFSLMSFTQLAAQDKFTFDPWQKDTLIVAQHELSAIIFPGRYRIMVPSIQVRINQQTLQEFSGFEFNPAKNQLNLYVSAREGDSVRVLYRIQPILLRPAYSFFALDTLKTVRTRQDSLVLLKPAFQNPFADFGSQLQKSGSIVRGITIGTNRDLTLNSGLNLQLSGFITEDVEVIAALTDESTPIQPEGNTQTLNEVDKVFIQFKHPYLQGTLGDFNLEYGYGRFGSLSRRLQGISLSSSYRNYSAAASVASTRGFFNFMTFLGQEGNQGPYQLLGKNSEQQIIVLAGTERVWVDGVKMVRGENNDYIIEYADGQLTFTNRRLITSTSRIEVDFEYYPATQNYSRTVYSGALGADAPDAKLKLTAMYYQEEDDPNKLLETEGILDQQKKDIIRQAGDDQLRAFVSGATAVEDSSGSYIKIDTLINNTTYSYFRYVGEKGGNYTVRFSTVGANQGDYIREQLGVYRWVGKGNGSYLPVELLPLPVRQQLTDFQIGYAPFKNLSISSEYAFSKFDRNILSPYMDQDNLGSAMQLGTTFSLLPFNQASVTQERIRSSTIFRLIDRNFQPADRLNQIDYRRYWNILSPTLTDNAEKSVESNLSTYPFDYFRLNGNLGFLKREQFQSNRYQGQLDWTHPNWFNLLLSHELVSSKQENTTNDWVRQNAHIDKTVGHWQPGLTLNHENRKNKTPAQLSGFEFYEWTARMDFINHPLLSGFTQYIQRDDRLYDQAAEGKLIPQATTRTEQIRIDLKEWRQTSGSLEIVKRKKDYTPFFEKTRIDSNTLRTIDATVQDTVWRDRQTTLAELILNNYQLEHAFDLRWQYRISTEQLALREKVYLDVGEGKGNLRYDSQLAEYVPDPDGNFILYIIPSGKFEPVTSVESSLNLKLDPSRHWKNATSTWQQIATLLTSESYLRIEEQSKQKNINDLLFLNISTFQGAQTIRGLILFSEDLYIMRQSRKLSFRLRYQYRDDQLNQFLNPGENEDRLGIERGLRANYQLHRTLKVQSEIHANTFYRNNKSDLARNRDITSWIINQNFSYRPLTAWEFGTESELGLEKDVANDKNLSLQYLDLLTRINYSLLQKGRLTAEYDILSVNVLRNPSHSAIPYEMARGKKEGLNRQWHLRGDYTLATNIVFSVFYEGRADATYQKTVHSGQAEIRAYF